MANTFAGKFYPLSPGNINGLKPRYFSTFQARIEIGTCRDSTDTVNIQVTSELTVSLTTSGANGLDAGSEASSTLYYVFVIAQADGTVAGLYSVESAPSLPGSYIYYRHVGYIFNGSTSNIERFSTVGKGNLRQFHFRISDSQTRILANGTATTATNVSIAPYAPAETTSVQMMYLVRAGDSATGRAQLLTEIDAAPHTIAPNFSNTTGFTYGTEPWVNVNPSQNVRYRWQSVSTNYSLYLSIMAFEYEL